MVIDPAPVVKESPVIQPVSSRESSPMVEPAPASISDREWEAWKRQYWHDEKLRAKNEKFLSLVSICVDRANEIIAERGNYGVDLYLGSNAVKSKLRDLHYKSKVLLYNLAIFDQGILYGEEMSNMPLVWATNGHIGISALVYFNIYVQHEPSKMKTLRFDWDGVPILCELPEERKFLVLNGGKRARHRRSTM
jgi:hypothetical protein